MMLGYILLLPASLKRYQRVEHVESASWHYNDGIYQSSLCSR